MAVQQMTCTGCGAEANASCNCGKPYVPVKQRVGEYDKEKPGRSTRQAAADLGISNMAVSKARNSGVNQFTPTEVTGRDGKVYRIPVREVEEPPDEEFAKKQFVFAAESVIETAKDATEYVERMKFIGNEAEELCEITERIISQWNAVKSAIRKAST
jgi:hypothetical protein